MLTDEECIAINILKHDASEFETIDEKLRLDKEFLKNALACTNCRILPYFSECMKNDKEIASRVITSRSGLFFMLGENIKKDKQICESAVAYLSSDIAHVDKLLYDDDVFMEHAVKVIDNPENESLKYASKRLQDDYAVVLASVSSRGESLKYASQRLRNNEDIVKAAVTSKNYAGYAGYRFASKRIRKNKEIALLAIAQSNAEAFDYVGNKLKNDEQFIIEAYGVNKSMLRYRVCRDLIEIK